MKSENVKAWYLVRFMARLKFRRVPDRTVPVGKNTIRRSDEDPKWKATRFPACFLSIGALKNFKISALMQFVLPTIPP